VKLGSHPPQLRSHPTPQISTPKTTNVFLQLFSNGTTNRKRESTRKGEGRGKRGVYFLEYTFYGAFAPLTESETDIQLTEIAVV
jgi:hypothetical protein